jgi:hypothetical protein
VAGEKSTAGSQELDRGAGIRQDRQQIPRRSIDPARQSHNLSPE